MTRYPELLDACKIVLNARAQMRGAQTTDDLWDVAAEVLMAHGIADETVHAMLADDLALYSEETLANVQEVVAGANVEAVVAQKLRTIPRAVRCETVSLTNGAAVIFTYARAHEEVPK
jgi:ATP/maltotriose-dependent transcriptional regulator MalT